jgi:hypothetical protein
MLKYNTQKTHEEVYYTKREQKHTDTNSELNIHVCVILSVYVGKQSILYLKIRLYLYYKI